MEVSAGDLVNASSRGAACAPSGGPEAGCPDHSAAAKEISSAAAGIFTASAAGGVAPASRMFVTIHSLADAVRVMAAAREAGVEAHHGIGLISAPGAAGYMGVRLWRAIIDAAERDTGIVLHDVLDCGAQAGWACAALRAGQKRIVLSRCCPQFDAVNLLACEYSAEIAEIRPESFRISPRAGLEELVHLLRQGYVAIGAGYRNAPARYQRTQVMRKEVGHESHAAGQGNSSQLRE